MLEVIDMVPLWLVERMVSWIAEDVGMGDITSNALVDDHEVAMAVVIVKEDAVVAGIEETTALLRHLGLEVYPKVTDGQSLNANTIIMEIEGNARRILLAERTVLNILGRMSGIATLTAKAIEKARTLNPNIRIAATRKTTPGFSYMEKRAVTVGGGDSHRWHLDDMVLIKDNHLSIFRGTASQAIKKVRNCVSFSKKIEIEVADIETAIECAEAGVDIIMLDNFSPEDVSHAFKRIKAINPSIIVEVSGGITLENIDKYAKYCDVISMGMLTHSPKAIDVSMEIKGVEYD